MEVFGLNLFPEPILKENELPSVNIADYDQIVEEEDASDVVQYEEDSEFASVPIDYPAPVEEDETSVDDAYYEDNKAGILPADGAAAIVDVAPDTLLAANTAHVELLTVGFSGMTARELAHDMWQIVVYKNKLSVDGHNVPINLFCPSVAIRDWLSRITPDDVHDVTTSFQMPCDKVAGVPKDTFDEFADFFAQFGPYGVAVQVLLQKLGARARNNGASQRKRKSQGELKDHTRKTLRMIDDLASMGDSEAMDPNILLAMIRDEVRQLEARL